MKNTFSKTLNVKEIKDFGKLVLNQALNTRRVVAFIGSGISTAYGRCSWKDMLIDLIKAAIDLDELHDQNAATKEHIESLTSILKEQLDLLQQDKNDDNRNFPVALSLCEALYRLKDQNNSEKEFRKAVRKMVASHKYHTQQSLFKRYEVFKSFVAEAPNKDIDEIKNKIYETNYSPLFYECGVIEQVKVYFSQDKNSYEYQFLEEVWKQSIGVKVCDLIVNNDDLVKKKSNLYRTDERNIFSIMLLAAELAEKPIKKQIGMLLNKKLTELLELNNQPTNNPQCQNQQDKKMIRYELARPTLDPLHKIYSTLNISRFLTTNYDLEIERYLENLDFPLATLTTEIDNDKKTEVKTKSRLGQEARSLSFIPKSAGDLMDFAVGAKEISVDILHLHGRVNDGENMVITEDDYRDYYLKPKDNREHIQNGLDVIWGGNPIVFMGVGLQEEDLLRPLRQFVSIKPKEKRPIIAFMCKSLD